MTDNLSTESEELDLDLWELDQTDWAEITKMLASEENKKSIIRSEKKFMKYLVFAWAWFIVSTAVLYLLFTVNKFYVINWMDTQLSEEDKAFVDSYKENKQSILWLVWMWEEEIKTISFDEKQKDIWAVKNDIKDYIWDKSISYINKKDEIGKIMINTTELIKKYKDSLDKVKRDISKYSFLPKEIDDSISDSEIQKSIISVESIKFFTALNVFSHLWASVKELAEFLGYAPDVVAHTLDFFVKRWEADTQRYLVSCYLNPYEMEKWNDVCSYIDDFSNFYLFSNNKAKFDSLIFKRIMTYIEQKLEFSSLSRLSIVLNQLDPKSNTIWFSVEVNTLNEDEKDIIDMNLEWWSNQNLHIFIVTNIIKLLRESHFILWSDIKLNDVKINKRKVKVWDGEINVNNSTFTFNIPVQKSVEREIYDFVYSK